uniref:Uncharacterized protein n=1 Tax=Microcebus murinus TaxID=30608 RepID=A0A8C5XHQ1_MICMU
MAAEWSVVVLVTVLLGLARAGPVPTSKPSHLPFLTCHLTCPFPCSQDWERPVALEAELALTLKVLATMADADLGDVLDRPLRTLRHIRPSAAGAAHTCPLCPQGPAAPTAGPRPRGRLQHWLHRLQVAPRKESPGCLEASVTFNLFRLLTRDLKCVNLDHPPSL